MSDNKYTIGIDYGTLSGRALLVRVSDGCEMGSSVFAYPHGVMDEFLDAPAGKIALPPDWALEHPADYLEVLTRTVPDVIAQCGIDPADVIGIGIDFTSCTLIPTYADGTPLCMTPEFENNPHAYPILWKHHAAQKYANRLNAIAEERNEPWLKYYGGAISSEWTFPKIWQVLDEAPEVYEKADKFIECGDWIVWQLTGNATRGGCHEGYKSMYTDDGYPSPDFFRALDPGLENVIADKCSDPVLSPGQRAGTLTDEMAEKLGLNPGIAVAVSVPDAHVASPAMRVGKIGRLLAIMGTSTCHLLVSDKLVPVPGICGVVKDGVLPGFYGYEAGQGCVGDHFAWFTDHFTPVSYHEEALSRGMTDIQIMSEKADALKPGESGILALDWWNGNRSILVDTDLSGMFLGMTLTTKPEELFRALLEATACGTRMIVENYREHGIEVNEYIAAGGIAKKAPGMMQIYADVTGMEIHIASSTQGPALGSAIYASCAAGAENGGYDTIAEASEKMGTKYDKTYRPIPGNRAVYDKLYAEYKLLHDYFGRGENNVMKRLRDLKADTKR